jgi:hypothetical protein
MMVEMIFEIVCVTAVVVGVVTLALIGVLGVEELINRWKDR